jgi:hypothetical protein
MNMGRRINFLDLLDVYKEVESLDKGVGYLEIKDLALIYKIQLLSHTDNADDSGISILAGDPDNLTVGQKIKVEITPPRTGLGLFVLSFDDYLKAPEAKISEKNNYYIYDLSFFSKDEDAPVEVLNYRKLLSFVELVGGAAHYLDHKKEEAVFFDAGKYVIPINYSVSDVLALDAQELGDLINFCQSEPHASQKKSIFRETLVRISADFPVDSRFKYLINNIPVLLEALMLGYDSFASSFTYEKVRDELESLKLDMTIKIHKAISDIQGQILGIPVATVLAVSQMKETKLLDSQFVYNTALMLGVIIFSILMVGFIWNQKLTLDSIEEEVVRLKTKYKERMSDARPVFRNIFKSLCDRLVLQYLAVYLVLALLFVAFSVSLVFYFVFTDQARNVL